MKIKSLHLENFQKHKDLKVDFSDNVNIIHGESDRGKSCIRRALEWIFFNKKIDGIRKTGSKSTTVTVELDNNIKVSRTKSSSINRYIIHEEGQEDKTFDSIGKSIPDEVKDVLKSSMLTIDDEDICLNSSEQLSLPFLFDKSPSFRAKLFNKLTGNDVLDGLFGNFNKTILRLNKEIKKDKESVDEQTKAVEKTEIEKEKQEFLYKRVKNSLSDIKQKHDKYCKLLEINELDKKIEKQLEQLNNEMLSVKKLEVIDPQQLIEKNNKLDTLKTLEIALEKNKVTLDRVTVDLDIKVPQIEDVSKYQGKLERLDTIKTLFNDINSINVKYNDVVNSIKTKSTELEEEKQNYIVLLKECELCPTCGVKMSEEHLKEVKL